MSKATEFILIRHGETEANRLGIIQGHLDWPLTANGIAQAEALAKRLRSLPFQALYSSDLGRARQTAEIIAQETGHEVHLSSALRERKLGIFQGLTIAEILARYPREWKAFLSDPEVAAPEGESVQQRLRLMVAYLEDLAAQHEGESVVVVTHGGALSSLLSFVLGLPPAAPRRYRIWNASLNIFSFDGESWLLHTWGDVSHLQSLATRRVLDHGEGR